MLIIPAIDIIGGKCVRLTKGEYSSVKTYSEDPIGMAKTFEDAGLTHLHVVDLEGAKRGECVNLNTLEAICRQTSLIVDFGGGIKSKDSLQAALSAGANAVTVGSLAVKQRDIVLEMISSYPSSLILGADCRNRLIATSGWQEDSKLEVTEFISYYYEKGIRKTISTDISRDGMLSGPSFELYEAIKERVPGIDIIASGGVSSLSDLLKLKEQGLYGAIVGKAYYEGKVSLKELAEVNNAC